MRFDRRYCRGGAHRNDFNLLRAVMHKRDWDDHEERTLRRDVGLRPLGEIAIDLGRTRKSVESKVARMKGGPRIKFERDQLGNAEMLCVKQFSDQARGG